MAKLCRARGLLRVLGDLNAWFWSFPDLWPPMPTTIVVAMISAAKREPPSRYKVPPAKQAAHSDPSIQSTIPNYRVVPKVPVSPLNNTPGGCG